MLGSEIGRTHRTDSRQSKTHTAPNVSTRQNVKGNDRLIYCDACGRYVPLVNFELISKDGHNAKAYNWDQTRPVFVFSCGRLQCDAICERKCDAFRKVAGLNWDHVSVIQPDKSPNQLHL